MIVETKTYKASYTPGKDLFLLLRDVNSKGSVPWSPGVGGPEAYLFACVGLESADYATSGLEAKLGIAGFTNGYC
ncbi:MAG: hypothetical protein Q8P12_02285 [bacterium]|nr:hypothetical protein [bacterium]